MNKAFEFIQTVYRTTFYKLKYMPKVERDEDGYIVKNQSGFYKVKREWLWLLLFPIVVGLQITKDILLSLLTRIVGYIPFVFTYMVTYNTSPKDRKFTLKEKINLINRLSK